MADLDHGQRVAVFVAALGLLGAGALLLMPFSVTGSDRASVQCDSPVSGDVIGGDIAELNARGLCDSASSARRISANVLAGLSLVAGVLGFLLFRDADGGRRREALDDDEVAEQPLDGSRLPFDRPRAVDER